MSKCITIEAENRQRVLEEMAQALSSYKASDGKFEFSKSFDNFEDRATITFAPLAWTKMMWLVNRFSDEVAWHGVCHRGELFEYFIDDIIVYPQIVNGVHVDTDQAAYRDWLYSQPNEIFCNLRMQGHSHVNMSVSPSGTDIKLFETYLEDLREDDYYIFMIVNKRNEVHVRCYDLLANRYFETNDCNIVIEGIGDFFVTSEQMVKSGFATTKTNDLKWKAKNTAIQASVDESPDIGCKTKYPYNWFDDDDDGCEGRDW